MSGDKKNEYEQAVTMYRFYHDYRMKILNYTLAFNAALLVVAIQHINSTPGKVLISVVAILATLMMLGFEMRTIRFANLIWERIAAIEKELGFATMSMLKESKGTPQRVYVRLLYLLLLLIWILVVVGVYISII